MDLVDPEPCYIEKMPVAAFEAGAVATLVVVAAAWTLAGGVIEIAYAVVEIVEADAFESHPVVAGAAAAVAVV